MSTPRTVAAPRRWPALFVALLAAFALLMTGLGPAQGRATSATTAPPAPAAAGKPTIVLVHGAWADASNWNGVVAELQRSGYRVAAIANPLRTLAGDAASVRAYVDAVPGPVVLVGHSYGGAVITNAAAGSTNVRALVYVNAFAPDEGESAVQLAGPKSALSVDPTTIFDFVPAGPPGPDTDLYLKRRTVYRSFATGLRFRDKRIVAASQRAATLGSLTEPSGPPAWRTIPSWFVLGTQDAIIPRGVQRTMAQRAGSTIVRYREGHLGLITDPATVAGGIKQAARATG
jgi:pimeloyl-ACP methyl ester carboxylesterase